MNGRRPPLLHPTNDRRLSVLFSSPSASFPVRHVLDRNALNSFPINPLRTTFFAMGGWGGLTSAHFKYHLNSVSFFTPLAPRAARGPSPPRHLLFFSITYELPILQVFSFDNVATVGWGEGAAYPNGKGGENHIG